jgi:alkylhydroperoxidase/carboxymuconolactone decarboxylase family protein YurZ
MSENPLARIGQLDPELMKMVQQLNSFALNDGALPRKMKILIAMALDAAHGSVQGVRALAMQAKASGATKDEIMEAIRVACYVNGGSCVYTASNAFRDLEL